MTPRALPLALAGAGLLLAGCAADDVEPTGASTRPAAPPAVELAVSDVLACDDFVAEAGEEYEWLNHVNETGSWAQVQDSDEFGVRLEVAGIGGVASGFSHALENEDLKAAMAVIESEGKRLQETVQHGIIDPPQLVAALEDAADVCSAGGVMITWR